jgi:hypothetical protein
LAFDSQIGRLIHKVFTLQEPELRAAPLGGAQPPRLIGEVKRIPKPSQVDNGVLAKKSWEDKKMRF